MCRDYIQLLVVAIETAFLKSSHPTTKVNLTWHEKTVLMYTKYTPSHYFIYFNFCKCYTSSVISLKSPLFAVLVPYILLISYV